VSTVPAAASDLVRPLLAGPVVSCAVVAASRTAVHLATGDGDVPVLSVVAPGGVRLPGGCVLADRGGPAHHAFDHSLLDPAAAHPALPLVVDHGDLAAAHVIDRFGAAHRVLVGGGAISVDDWSIKIHRWWSAPDVRMPDRWPDLREGAAALATAVDQRAGTLPRTIVSAVDGLAAAVEGGDHAAIESAVHEMVGLGPGLTPAADDVLVGALLGWHYLALAGWVGAMSVARTVSTAVGEQLHRTGAVSAALLHHAVAGNSVPEALFLLDALRTPGAVGAAVDALRRVGEDTGRSTAYGIKIAVQVVLGAFDPERVAL
jgi:hypothetical protein